MICMEGETVKQRWDFSSSHHTIEKFFIFPLFFFQLLISRLSWLLKCLHDRLFSFDQRVADVINGAQGYSSECIITVFHVFLYCDWRHAAPSLSLSLVFLSFVLSFFRFFGCLLASLTRACTSMVFSFRFIRFLFVYRTEK